MLGFDLDLWDYLTFLVMFIAFGAALAVAVLVLGLPGRIAIARKHPDADAINTMGWLGVPGSCAVDASVHVGFQTYERCTTSLFPKTRARKHRRRTGAIDRA